MLPGGTANVQPVDTPPMLKRTRRRAGFAISEVAADDQSSTTPLLRLA